MMSMIAVPRLLRRQRQTPHPPVAVRFLLLRDRRIISQLVQYRGNVELL